MSVEVSRGGDDGQEQIDSADSSRIAYVAKRHSPYHSSAPRRSAPMSDGLGG